MLQEAACSRRAPCCDSCALCRLRFPAGLCKSITTPLFSSRQVLQETTICISDSTLHEEACTQQALSSGRSSCITVRLSMRACKREGKAGGKGTQGLRGRIMDQCQGCQLEQLGTGQQHEPRLHAGAGDAGACRRLPGHELLPALHSQCPEQMCM